MDRKNSLRKRKRPSDENQGDSSSGSKKPRAEEVSLSSFASVVPVTTIENLPVEMLDHIFSFLDAKSLKTASLVNKSWLQKIFTPIYAKKFPLIFDHCIFRTGYTPQTIFEKTQNFREFPYIQIGNVSGKKYGVTNDDDVQNLYAMMTKIGQHTQFLYLTETINIPESILKCFPNLKELRLKTLDMIGKFDVVPDSLRTVIVDTMYDQVEQDILTRLRSLTQVEIVKCNSFDLDGAMSFLEISSPLKQFLETHDPDMLLKTSKNLLSNSELTFEDVYGVELDDDFTGFNDLTQFSKLQELCMESQTGCYKFHEILNLKDVKILKLCCNTSNAGKRLCHICYANILESLSDLTSLTIHSTLSTQQMKRICKKFPNLQKLSINMRQLNTAFFNKQQGDEDDEPYLGSLGQLQKLGLMDGYGGVKKSWSIFVHFPNLPNLTDLYVNTVNFVNGSYAKAYKALPKRCPNVRHLAIRKTGQVRMQEITEGWPGLLSLTIFFFINFKHYPEDNALDPHDIKLLTDNCKYLRSLNVQSSAPWLGFEKDWQMKMFENLEHLRSIEIDGYKDWDVGYETMFREEYYN